MTVDRFPLLQTYNPALRLKPDAMTATGSGELTLASGIRQSLSAASDTAAEETDNLEGGSSSRVTGPIAKGPII